MKADTYNFQLRLPKELSNVIIEMANDEKRPVPLNTQIVLLLEYAIREKTRKRKKVLTEHNP